MTDTMTRAVTTADAPRSRRRSRATGMPPGERQSSVLTVVIWLCAGYFLIPLLWLVIASTKDNTGLFSTFGLWFSGEFHLWDNLVQLFTQRDGVFGLWMWNTVLYAVVSGVGAAILSAAAGYAFAKYDFPAKKFLFAVVLGAIMVPTTALAIPTYLLFASAGLTNTVWAKPAAAAKPADAAPSAAAPLTGTPAACLPSAAPKPAPDPTPWRWWLSPAPPARPSAPTPPAAA